METALSQFTARAFAFQAEAHRILGVHEAAQSRVVVLEDSYNQLKVLNLRQDDLMRQALRCVESGLYRAAHVMAWAAFMDFLEEKLESDGLHKVRVARPNWKGRNMAEMREFVPERQIVEVTRDIGLCTKNVVKHLTGLLDRRNDCAHPSSYYPQLNETLGYISELLQRMRFLFPKTL